MTGMASNGLKELARAVGLDAEGCTLILPDGTEVHGYRPETIRGGLPDGWRAYDIMECDDERWHAYPGFEDLDEDEREDGVNGRYETVLAIDTTPGPHIVNQGAPFVTTADLSDVSCEFDEDHWWYDGTRLRDRI